MQAWLQLVGDVWLVGTHPRWSTSDGADPLVIQLEGSRRSGGCSIIEVFAEDIDAQEEEGAYWGVEGGIVLPVAPDRLHKGSTSGGDPYGFILPDGGVDATFVDGARRHFVDHLNRVCSHGGFPAATGDPAQAEVTARLAAGLLHL